MKNRSLYNFSVLLLTICISPLCQAQLLWEISGKNLEQPSYLFGTMHISDERVFNFPKSLVEKLQNCQVFAGELKVDQEMSFKMMPHLFMEGDISLQDLYNEEEYAFIKKRINSKLGILAPFAEKIKPVFISVLMSENDFSEMRKPPLDLYLQQLAEKNNLEVIGLESFEEQLTVFNKIPLDLQAQQLYEELQNLEEGNDEKEKLITMYLSADLESLYEATKSEFSADLNDMLLYKRNHLMASRINVQIKEKPTFIAIGAAHLPGEEGVIKLLRDKGYKVHPVE